MCQATVYRKRNGEEEDIFKDVIFMERTKDGWVVKALLEEPRRVHGQIERIDFLKHTVTVLQKVP